MSRDKQISNPEISRTGPILSMDQLVLPPSDALPKTSPAPGVVTQGQASNVDPQRAVNEREILSRIQHNLGLSQTLQSDQELAVLVEEQLPVKAISALTKNGLNEKEVYSLLIPRRTLQHRRARKERLSIEESDRAVRVARILALAAQVFGDQDIAMQELRSTKSLFGDHTPLEMLATEAGGRLVEEWLYQIDEGMVA